MSGLGCFASLIIFFISNAHSSDVHYEVVPENVSECHTPLPPFSKRRVFLSEFSIHKRGQIVYLSGQHRVLAEVPFTNVSVRSFRLDDSGQREPIIQLDKVNCRSWMGKLFLNTISFRYNPRNCKMKKGIYAFKDLDVNTIADKVPSWHAKGVLTCGECGRTFSAKIGHVSHQRAHHRRS